VARVRSHWRPSGAVEYGSSAHSRISCGVGTAGRANPLKDPSATVAPADSNDARTDPSRTAPDSRSTISPPGPARGQDAPGSFRTLGQRVRTAIAAGIWAGDRFSDRFGCHSARSGLEPQGLPSPSPPTPTPFAHPPRHASCSQLPRCNLALSHARLSVWRRSPDEGRLSIVEVISVSGPVAREAPSLATGSAAVIRFRSAPVHGHVHRLNALVDVAQLIRVRIPAAF
jgi:hypothetical protein